MATLLSAKRIPAGKKGQIEIKINTESMSGPQKKQVAVSTNDSRNRTVILSVQAKVEPEIGLSDSSIYFENTPAGKEARKEILLTLPAQKDIRILSVVSSDPQITAKLEPVPGSNGKQFKLIAAQKATAKQGYHFGNIVVKTKGGLTHELVIYVLGTVVAPQK